MNGPLTHLQYIPEQHTDFIFSVVGEEFGFVGCLILIGLYLLLLSRMLAIIEKTYNDKFGSLLGVGIFTIFAFQITTNLLMVMGLFPVVGLPLPLLSYGGSSFTLFICCLGIMQSLALHQYNVKYLEKQ